MGLFGLFGKKAGKAAPAEKAEEGSFLEDYAGIEAAVTDTEGRLLFTAKLLGLEENHGDLHQLSDLEGAISPTEDERIWRVENLTLVKLENDRSYFRMDVSMDATLISVGRPGAEEEPCKLVNISVGGVRIASANQHQIGDRLLISVDLTPGKAPSTMLCQVLRIIGQDQDYEYGCRFIELNDADEDRIMQIIFALQRKQSGRL